jgi:hypothetical protein
MSHRQTLMSDYQNGFQIFHGIQKQDHIFHNKPLRHYFLKIYSQTFSAISAYKDPVENHHMKKIIDKFVTGFFVAVLRILWYCSSKYQITPNQYTIVIYDVYGNQTKIDRIRTSFSTYQVANSYILEYQNRFVNHNFSMATQMPEIKNRLLVIFKNIQR